MQRKWFFHTLCLFLLPIIPVFLIGFLSTVLSRQFINVESTANSQMMLNQSRGKIAMLLGEIDETGLFFDKDPSLVLGIKGIMRTEQLSLENIRTLNFIKNYLIVQIASKPYIHSISIYYNNPWDRYLYVNSIDGMGIFDAVEKAPLTQHYWEHSEKAGLFYELYAENTATDSQMPLLTIYRRLYLSGSSRSEGFVAINFYSSFFEDMVQSIKTYNGQIAFVLDEESGTILFGGNHQYGVQLDPSTLRQESGTVLLDRELYHYSTLSLDRFSWRVVSMIPESELFALSRQIWGISCALLAVSAMLSIAISYSISRIRHRQLLTISDLFESAREKRPLPAVRHARNNEYGYMLKNVVTMFLEQNYLRVRLSERKYRMQALELLALQSQINPHFLFNTLNAIYWAAFELSKSPNKATLMVGNLSEILKYALDSPDKEVSLRQEIQYTKHYLQIQSMRHENRFAVQWQYTPDVLDIPTIRLIIQPLVENCIYHATEKTDRKVAIKIALRIRHGRLRIAVIDNGQGMSAQMLRRLREIPLRNEPEEPGAHIGLYNTVKRLQLKYNCANPFSIRSRPGRGTFVRLDIPLAEPKAEARATVEQACKT